MNIKITGTGSYIPNVVMKNADFNQHQFLNEDGSAFKQTNDIIDTQPNIVNTVGSEILSDAIYSGLKESTLDIGFRKAKFPNSNKWAPCITAQPNMWCVPKHRKANIQEYLSLQGFPTKGFIQNISDHQFKKKIGNSMTVDVIEALLIECFKNINMII